MSHVLFRAIRMAAVCSTVLLSAPCVDAARGQDHEIVQHFPANAPAQEMRTRWRVTWSVERHAGGSEVLCIKGAYFQRDPQGPEIKVLADCRLAEIFVPYNGGTRIYDLTGHSFELVDLDRSELGPSCVTPGALLGRNGAEVEGTNERGVLAKEVHDDHLRWMDMQDDSRRGQRLSLWSVLDGANYRYIIKYEFYDDGRVACRLGATASNLFDANDDGTTHLHMGCWRLAFDLGGATRVSVVRLDTVLGKTNVQPVDVEAAFPWKPEEFTRLRVESTTVKNQHNPPNPISYDLHPGGPGIGRYTGQGEEFTSNDLWVTRTNAIELRYRDLASYLDNEGIGAGQAVLWHQAAVVHNPRDEDFGRDGYVSSEGVALTAWAGFELKPRNLFASTPLYP